MGFVEVKSKCKIEVERDKKKGLTTYTKLVNWAWRNQEEVVEALLVAHLLKFASKGPVAKVYQYLRFGRGNDEDNCIIMGIAIRKC